MCCTFFLSLGGLKVVQDITSKVCKNWNDLATVFLAQFMGSKARLLLKNEWQVSSNGKASHLKAILAYSTNSP